MSGFEKETPLYLSDLSNTELINQLQNLSPAPRQIPLSIKCKSISYASIFTIIMIVIAIKPLLSSRIFFSIRLLEVDKRATATVIKIEKSYRDVNKKSRVGKGTPIYMVYYKFLASNGIEYTQFSYLVGGLYKDRFVSIGQSVEIQYISENPKFSCIIESSYTVFDFGDFIFLLYPIFGFALLIRNYRMGIKNIRLLKHGAITNGKINNEISEDDSRKIYFEYTDDTGEICQAHCSLRQKNKIQIEKNEPLIYYKDKHGCYAKLIRALSPKMYLDKNGNWKTNWSRFSIVLFFLFESILWVLVGILLVKVLDQLV